MNVRHHRAVSAVFLVLIATTSGCGTGIDDAVFAAVDAAGRTTLDLFLTELANRIAESFEQDQATPEDRDRDGDTGDGAPDNDAGTDVGDGGNGSDQSGGDLVGNSANGETIYALEGCSGCHCDDASGGCALDAPALGGVDFKKLSETFLDDAFHPTKPALSSQDLADLEAYLDSL